MQAINNLPKLQSYLEKFANALILLGVCLALLVIIYPNFLLLLTYVKKAPLSNQVSMFAGFSSLILACLLTLRIKTFLDLKLNYQRLLIILFPLFALLIYLFTLRTNFNIYDIFYPTYLVGMTERARQGLLPITFTAFPEFPANYHQAFIILAAGIAQLTHWTSLQSLVFLFPALLLPMLLVIFLTACQSQSSTWIVAALILLLLFSSSFPYIGTIKSGAYAYLMFADIYFSNTWVLGSLTLFILALYFWLFENKSLPPWPLFILIFCLISINATLFSLVWLTVTLLLIIELSNQIKSHKPWQPTAFSLLILVVLYWLAHFIPSAFLKGPHYTSILLRVKYLNPCLRTRDLKESYEMLKLTGIWILLLGYALLPLVKQIRSLWQPSIIKASFPQLLLLLSLFFPLIISLDNVDRWDAIHKFAVTNILAGFLFLIQLLREQRIEKWQFCIFFALALVITLPNLRDFIQHRLSSYDNAFWRNLPDRENQDFIQYLQAQPARIKIYPVYQTGGGSEIAILASFSGDFVANTFYPGFLVNITLDQWPSARYWSSAPTFSTYLADSKLITVIVVAKDKNNAFLKLIKKFSTDSNFNIQVDLKHPIIFKHYVLYHYTKY